ncbi:hypothetical protein KAU04_07320 [bacterium]|nr:hypothetical protein [bacterium]MCK4597834.1 hypothetical protein [bacterium]
MASKKVSEGLPLLGLGFLGFVHEFVINDKAEIFASVLNFVGRSKLGDDVTIVVLKMLL